jgi:hypothetical protein
MSELTVNIADYRPLLRVRTHDRGPAVNERTGFVVLSSKPEPRMQGPGWLSAQTEVVDIRSVRESNRTHTRRGKILRFSNPASHRVYMMPAHHQHTPADDDPGPMVA